jgi:hypothetical protein
MPPLQHSHDGGNENENSRGRTDTFAQSVQWLTFLLFPIVSSLLFAVLFEWERYEIIAAPRGRTLSVGENSLLFWFLTAKSLVWFIPLAPLMAIMICSGLRRSATIILNLVWILTFYLMAVDLVTVSFMGNHIWDYLPYLDDIIKHPEQKFWQWAGDAVTIQALLVLACFVVSGPACYFLVRWATVRLANRFEWLCSRRGLIAFTLIPAVSVSIVLPVLAVYQDRNLLERVFSSLPFTTAIRESMQSATDDLATWLRMPPNKLIAAGLSAVAQQEPARSTKRSASLEHGLEDEAYQFPVFTLEDGSSSNQQREDLLKTDRSASAGRLSLENWSQRLFRKPSAHDQDARNFMFELSLHQPTLSSDVLDEHDKLTALRYLREAASPGSVDSTAFVRKKRLPNVVMIIFESFRHSAIGPELMSELDAWAEQGLRLERHYSGSNCSHLGLFSLFYGRAALGFHRTLDRNIPSQMLESLRRSGYKISFLTSGEIQGFRRINQFISDKSCDNVIMEGEYRLNSMNDWPDSDRRKLDRARSIVNTAQDEPQFVFFYLLSSHYRYPCPPEFESFKEDSSVWQFFNPQVQIRNHLGRYANSLRFLQHEVMNFIRSIDPKRNIVMITGDHGESMGEDGVFIHASRMSDVQLRVPLVMVGPGIEHRKIPTATVHTDILPTLLHALAGTAVPIANCQGRDLIGDLAPADEVAITRPKWPEWDGLMIVRGDKRMLFKAQVAESDPFPSTEFAGLLDQWGQYEFKVDSRARRALRMPR